jgi:hypothetical protein
MSLIDLNLFLSHLLSCLLGEFLLFLGFILFVHHDAKFLLGGFLLDDKLFLVNFELGL